MDRKLTREDNLRLDANAKAILSQKSILSFIMRNAVPEYRDVPQKEIEERYIDSIFVSGMGKGGSIIGINTESTSITEGKIIFDIIFNAALPGMDGETNEDIGLIINIEAQKYEPYGYDLVSRGIYYCCRILSSEKGRYFRGSGYANMRKVYSIWICMDPDRKSRSSISSYGIEEKCLLGDVHKERKSYDLLSVVMLNLGGEGSSGNGLIDALEIIFSTAVDIDDKVNALSGYGIELDGDAKEMMEDMCNLSEGFEERGFKKGEEEKAKETAIAMYKDGISIDKISYYVGYPVDMVKSWV